MITLKKLLYGGLLALLIILPSHTVITVWLTSEFGHLYFWSGWKEVLLLILSLCGAALLAADRKLRHQLARPLYNQLALAYVGLCGVYALAQGLPSSALVGLALNTRFVVAFWLAQIVAFYFPRKLGNIKKVVVGVAAIVALFGVLQVTVLEPTILTRVGYDPIGVNTVGIPPAIHKVAADSSIYRAQSSLRGPNILGAYLILPITLTIYAYYAGRSKKFVAILALLVAALLLSHSRSAILGLAGGLLVWASLKYSPAKLIGKYKYALAAVVIAVIAASALVWRTDVFQTVVLHNNPDVTIVQSNQGHLELTKQAAEEVARGPLGDGLGSAGPSSALDETSQARIAENYYLQLGQEIGWLGMGLFIALQVAVFVALVRRRQQPYVLPVLSAMVAVSLTSLLLHTWTDEVVAIMVWSMAGYVLAMPAKTKPS